MAQFNQQPAIIVMIHQAHCDQATHTSQFEKSDEMNNSNTSTTIARTHKSGFDAVALPHNSHNVESESAIKTIALGGNEDLASKMWDGNSSWSWQDEIDFWEEEGMESSSDIEQPQTIVANDTDSDLESKMSEGNSSVSSWSWQDEMDFWEEEGMASSSDIEQAQASIVANDMASDPKSKMCQGTSSWSWQDEMDFWMEEGMESSSVIEQLEVPIVANSTESDLETKMCEVISSWSWQDEMDFWEEEGMESSSGIEQPQPSMIANDTDSDSDTLSNDGSEHSDTEHTSSDPIIYDDEEPSLDDYYNKFNSDGYPMYLTLPIPSHVINEDYKAERTFPAIAPLSKNGIDVLDVKGHSDVEKMSLRKAGFKAEIKKVTSGELRVLLDGRLFQYRCKPSNLRSSLTAI